MGLLLSHNCTLVLEGDMIRIKSEGERPEGSGGKRGEVKGFSRNSRVRLLDALHAVYFEKATFVTLTYPGVFPTDGQEVKRHLKNFRARLERKYGQFQVVWRVEFQRRGAPHYHLLLFDAPFIPRVWVSLAWYQIVNSSDERHLTAGTQVKGPIHREKSKAIMTYVSKYVGKIDDNEVPGGYENVGRHWGFWNKQEAETLELDITKSEADTLVGRILGNLQDRRRWEPANRTSCRIYGDSMGTDGFANRALEYLGKIRSARIERRAITQVRIDVE